MTCVVGLVAAGNSGREQDGPSRQPADRRGGSFLSLRPKTRLHVRLECSLSLSDRESRPDASLPPARPPRPRAAARSKLFLDYGDDIQTVGVIPFITSPPASKCVLRWPLSSCLACRLIGSSPFALSPNCFLNHLVIT